MQSHRKLVTVLSLDVVGQPDAATEDVAGGGTDFPSALSRRVEAIVAAHGGKTELRGNDTRLAIFGADQAREDEPAMAVRAALALLQGGTDIRPQGSPAHWPLKIGIHTGMVAVESGGAAGAAGARGDSIALAGQLQDSAPAGSVVISQDTYRHVYGLFDVQSVTSIRTTDRDEPIQAYRVLQARPRSLARTLRGVEGAETEMVGRVNELGELKSAFCAAVEKRELQMVTILGEAGIGKSRLLHEFQRWLQSVPYRARLFCGRAEAEVAGLPFSLMRDAFAARFEIQESDPMNVACEKFTRGFLDLLGETGPDHERGEATLHSHFIGHLLGFDFSANPAVGGLVNDPQQIRHRAFEGLSRFFASSSIASSGAATSAAEPSPGATLLVLEDLHWSDEDSLDLIAHLAHSCQRAPLMILSLSRPTLLERRAAWGEGAANCRRMTLGPLSTRESELLVQSILRKVPSLPLALRSLILAGAAGNPFYIEEIIKMLIEDQVIVPGPGSWRLQADRLALAAVPPTLTGVLQARLDGLQPLERAVLQSASVVGHVFWGTAIESLGGLGESPDGGGSTSESGTSQQEIQGALNGLCSKELIHRREFSGFADTVEYSFKHELLRNVAYQGLGNKRRREYHAGMAHWLMEHSGERIKELAGLVAVHFEQAGRVVDAAGWYGRAGQQARAGYAPAAAIEYFQKALRLLALAPEATGKGNEGPLDWHEGLSETLATQARFVEALDGYSKARALAEAAGDLAAQARAWNGIAFLRERRGDNRASVEAAETAELLAHRAGRGSRSELIRALHLKGWAFYRLGDAHTVLSLAAQTLKLCEESGHRRSMAVSFKLYGVAHLQLGHYEEADRYFQQGLSLCLELNDRRDAGAMFSNLGESARLRGDHHAAVELYQKALAIAREIGDRPSEAIYLSNLSGARLGLRQFKEAESGLRQVIGLTAMPKSCSLSETYGFLASACLGQDKLAEALDAAELAVAIAKESENDLDLGGGLRVLGQVAAAMIQAAGTQGGIAASVADPGTYFSESLGVFEAIGAQGERATTLLNWAEFEKQQGRVAEGEKRLEEARKILAALKR